MQMDNNTLKAVVMLCITIAIICFIHGCAVMTDDMNRHDEAMAKLGFEYINRAWIKR